MSFSSPAANSTMPSAAMDSSIVAVVNGAESPDLRKCLPESPLPNKTADPLANLITANPGLDRTAG
jgi:hypothetical protein